MTLKEIAYKNLMRRKGKAAFILAGLVVGVATVVTVISFVEAMTKDINHKLEKYGANILIVPRTDSLTLTYGGLSIGGVSFEMQEIHHAELEKIKTIKNVRNIAAMGPIVLGGVQVKNRRMLLAGVDFKAAAILKPWWKVKGRFPVDRGVVFGSEAARILNLSPKESVTLNGVEWDVTGILEPTGSQDDHLAFARLGDVQKFLGKTGKISMVEVAALCTDCPIDDMVKQISEVLPAAKVMAIQQVVKGRMETISHFKKFSYGISAVVILVGGLVVLVTMMGSVRERTEEIGIFRAIGFRKRHVMRIVFLEAGLISGMAGVFGYLLGIGGTYLAFRFFSDGPVPAIPIEINLFAAAIALAVFIGLMSSAYPAFMASRLDPNDALRSL